jgi:signal transduction histidine kinase
VQRASTPDEVYQAITNEVAKLGCNTWIFSVAEDGQHLTLSYLSHSEMQLRAAYDLTGLTAIGYMIPLPHGSLLQRIVADGTPQFRESMVDLVTEALPEPYQALAGRVADLFGIRQGILVPLRLGDQVFSLMCVTGSHLTEADLPAFSAFAGQAATALDNARLYNDAQRRAERLATVNRIARLASEKLRLDDLVETVYQEIATTFEADAFFIALYDEETVELDYRLQVDEGVRELPERCALRPGLTAQIVTSKRPLLVSNFAEECAHLPPATLWGTGKPPTSWVGVPMRVGERVVGVISIQAYHADAYGPDDLLLLSTIADQLAVAAENARLFDAEREQRAMAEALAEAASAVASTLHLDQILDCILAQIERIVDGDAFNITLIDGDQARAARWRGYYELGLDDWIAGRAFVLARYPCLTRMIATKEPAVSADTRCDPDWVVGDEVQKSWRSYVGAPVEVKGEVVGFLSAVGLRPGQLDAVDARRLQILAGYAAIAIENGRLYRDLQIHADELELRVAERTGQLRAQYAALEAILHSTGDGIAVTDESGEIILTNPIVDRWLSETLSAGDAQQLQNEVRIVARRAVQRPTEVVELTGLDLQLQAAPISEPGMARAHAVVALHDVSHLKELDRLKSRFVSDVSHELRTPVASIRLYTELLRRTPMEDWGEWLDALEEEATRQARLVEDILEVSRLDSGHAELQRQQTELNELAEGLVASHQALAHAYGVNLSYRSAGPGTATVVDREKVSRALAHVVANAIQYTPHGGDVVVSCSIEQLDGCDWCALRVADTGIGIPEGELARIFERFYRGTQARQLRLAGTGLGLAIVKEIVDLHGGRVTVESEPGEGAVFTLWLPPGEEPACPSLSLPESADRDVCAIASQT